MNAANFDMNLSSFYIPLYTERKLIKQRTHKELLFRISNVVVHQRKVGSMTVHFNFSRVARDVLLKTETC